MTDLSLRRPPQHLEAEQAVLGAMLLNQKCVPSVMRQLKASHFYLQANRKVYEAIEKLVNKGQPVDSTCLISELRAVKEYDSVGGAPFISSLLNNIITTENVQEHAKIVVDCSLRRQLIQTATEIAAKAYDDEVAGRDAVSDAVSLLAGMMAESATGEAESIHIATLLAEHREVLKRRCQNKGGVVGIPTGIDKLDRETGGRQPGEIWVIGADSGIGKSLIGEQMSVTAARAGYPALFFSLEMGKFMVADRHIARESSLANWQVHKGLIPDKLWFEVEDVGRRDVETPYWIIPTPRLTLAQIQSLTRLEVLKHGIKSVVIDYLLQMDLQQGRGENEEQAIRRAMISLHAMAKELDVNVVLLQQLSRHKDRQHLPPIIQDLKGSQGIEAESDVVMLLWRPELQQCIAERRLMDTLELMVVKQRNGASCKLKTMLNCEHVKVVNGTNAEPPEMRISNAGTLEPAEEERDDIPE